MIILSDLSEVLIRGIYGAEEYISEYYGAGAAEKFVSRRGEIDDTFYELLRGSINEETYWQKFFEEGSYPFGFVDVYEAFSWNLTQDIPGTLEVYQQITAHPQSLGSHEPIMVKGMPAIYIVSDHINERINELKAEHPEIFRIVSDEYWSCDMGKIKQDPEFFPMLLGGTGRGPEEFVFVDDNPKNVASAKMAGIRGIEFTGASELKAALKALGFEFAPV